MAGIRLSGLASGMDIDSIVSKMMSAKRIPLDKLKQKKQTMEWQRDGYREINTLLLDFRSELTQMKLTTKYRSRTTTTTDESKVTATASSSAALSSFTISSVSKLATAATKVNKEAISKSGTKIDPKASLYNISDQFADSTFEWKTGSVESETINVTSDDTSSVSLKLTDGMKVKIENLSDISVKVNGESYQVVTGEPTDDNQVKIDADGNLTFNTGVSFKKNSTIKVDYIADQKVDTFAFTKESNGFSLTRGSINSISSFTVNEKTYTVDSWNIMDGETKVGTIDPTTGTISDFQIAADSTVSVTYTQNYFNFKMGSYDEEGKQVIGNFNIQGSESLDQVINKVNSSDAGVSMFYDSFKDQVTLIRNETGDFNTTGEEIYISGNFLNQVLKFDGATETGGQNAKFTLNGLETERYSNSFEINGVTLTLKKEFSDSAATISINNDANAVFENIKGFVDKYNELIGKIQGKIQEERYRPYSPLTDAQREQLSDKQEELWEEKAKSGLLRHDSTMTSLLSSMRLDFYGSVESENISQLYNQLSKIGIKTTSNYLEGGKLEINEAELKKAIENDPESVESLFRSSGISDSQKGIAQRLYDTVGKTMDILYEKAGKSYSVYDQYTMGKQLHDIEDQIDSYEDRLEDYEDRYYSQFTAMERAIQKANSQSTYLSQYFS
nr:flagellar filament capping protein FliD [uncultured Bacillus sp.]